MIYTRETTGSVEEVACRVEEATAANQFGVLGTHDLKAKMAAKGVEFDPECRVLEVCQPARAKRVLEANLAISTALPCRISVYEEAGKVMVATLLPTAQLGLFDEPGLESVASEVEETLTRIIDMACAG